MRTQTATPGTKVTSGVAHLNHEPTGAIKLSYDANAKTIAVTGTFNGLAPNSEHAMEIQQGACSATSAGTTKYTLPNVTADANGHADVNTTIQNVTDGIPASGLSLRVFSANKPEQHMTIGCRDITNNNQAPSVTVQMGPVPSVLNEHASGQANFNVQNGAATLQMNVQGLAANSTHLVQIRTGTCRAPGSVLSTIPSLKADGQGNVNNSTTLKGISSLPSGNVVIFVYTDTSNPTAAATAAATPTSAATATSTSSSVTATPTGQHVNEPILCGSLRQTS